MSAKKKNIVALGGILRRVGNFDPVIFQSDFNARLVLQKTIYFLQEFGLNIDYSYSWYLRGPYSPPLTRDAYELAKSYAKIQVVRFVDSEKERRFCEFLSFIKPIAYNRAYLERVASIHFLCKAYPFHSSDVVFRKVQAKIPSITMKEFQEIKSVLKAYKLLRIDS